MITLNAIKVPQKRFNPKVLILIILKGRVVTETFTEYRNVGDGDDSDFGNFGGSEEPSGAEEADDSSSTGDFEEDALAAHNMYRAKHGVEPLTLDREVRSLLFRYIPTHPWKQ